VSVNAFGLVPLPAPGKYMIRSHLTVSSGSTVAGPAADMTEIQAGHEVGRCGRSADGQLGGAGELAEAKPGLDDRVQVERHCVDALFEQPFGEIWVVAGALAADADVFAAGFAGLDRGADHEFAGRVAFVEASGDQGGVAVQAKRELAYTEARRVADLIRSALPDRGRHRSS
jgi:hypothetical protein